MTNTSIPEKATASPEAAVRTIVSLESLVQSLCRIAWTADNQADHEAFHSLMLDLLPSIGLRLDKAANQLGEAPTGIFADGTMRGMFMAQ